ncbi:RNA exonuclease 4 [Psilocybe cubensis]|uniref:Exonuclease domain-containing protein n=2 Tax=Psilocybe cubensis TaxID=181762 RepID=A0A8H8CPX3_PSICU|nr:RNA exonuclease 4 [Psilocybe cubensis]KAH9487015.1 RNA exonuclease 4 [Psilocybe cubensis]
MAPSIDRFIAISCTVVGVGPGGTTSLLARLAIVDYRGATIFDTYVTPTTTVTDYRTQQTGITHEHLNSAEAMSFADIQRHCSQFFRGKILVGHSLWNDLAGEAESNHLTLVEVRALTFFFDPSTVLGLPHRAIDTRDVGLYMPFRNALRSPSQTIGLQTLMWQLMSRRCQEGQINPVENARAALDLYRSDADAWEAAIGRGNWPCALPPSTFSRCYL